MARDSQPFRQRQRLDFFQRNWRRRVDSRRRKRRWLRRRRFLFFPLWRCRFGRRHRLFRRGRYRCGRRRCRRWRGGCGRRSGWWRRRRSRSGRWRSGCGGRRRDRFDGAAAGRRQFGHVLSQAIERFLAAARHARAIRQEVGAAGRADGAQLLFARLLCLCRRPEADDRSRDQGRDRAAFRLKGANHLSSPFLGIVMKEQDIKTDAADHCGAPPPAAHPHRMQRWQRAVPENGQLC